MKLYYSKGACSFAVRIILNEIGITSQYESVDLKTKKTESGKDFKDINPKGAVPTLEINDKEYLTENAVILQYLADSEKATKLLPSTADFKRYRVLEWLNYVSTEVHKTSGVQFSPVIPADIKEKIFIPLLKTKYDFLNHHLANNEYLLGNEFTLPDAYLFAVLRWAAFFHIDLNEWPHLNRYFENLHQRKSIHKSLVEEGLIKDTV